MATTTIAMPNFGQTTAENKIVGWLKSEGDRVERGDPLAEVETDKATVQVESYATGYLRRIIHTAPAVVAAGETIAILTSSPGEPVEIDAPPVTPAAAHGPLQTEETGETNGSVRTSGSGGASSRAIALSGGRSTAVAEARESPALTQVSQPPPAPPSEQTQETGLPERRLLATPMARKLAEELGVDLTLVVGSGPGGRILEGDVRAQAESARRTTEPAPAAEIAAPARARPAVEVPAVHGDDAAEYAELSAVRRATAIRMVRSVREAPQVALSVDCELTEAERLRARRGAAAGKKPSYTTLLVKVVAVALRRHPEMNVAYEDGRLRQHRDINVGLAIATPRGLLVPVIRDADRRSLDELGAAIETLRSHVSAGQMPFSAASGATFTISNLGMYGIDRFTAILNPPEAGILAVGRIASRPVSVGTAVESRLMVTLTLTVDHRVVDGVEAAGFLAAVRDLLENPYDLI